MPSLRILHVIDKLNLGGAERMCVTVSNLFCSKGYDVTVLELLKDGILQDSLVSGIVKKSLNRKWKFNIVTLIRLANELKAYDIIHVHMRHVYRYVFLANLISRKKLILHDHSNYFPDSWLQRKLFRILLKNHTYVVVVDDGYKWACDVLKLSRKNVFKLSNVILKENPPLQAKTSKIVLVSNIKPEKNIEFIVPFARHLLSNNSNVEIDVVGSIVDQKYFEEIISQLKYESFYNRISFITNRTSVQSSLAQYRLGLHFSKRESGPLVLLEYLAQDIPFVSYYTGEISKSLEIDLPLFFLFDFNISMWCKRVNEMWQNNIHHPNLSYIFEKHNNTENYIIQCIQIYQGIRS